MFIIKNIDVLIFQSPTGPNIDLSGVSAFNNAFNKTNVRLYSKPRGYFYLLLFFFSAKFYGYNTFSSWELYP